MKWKKIAGAILLAGVLTAVFWYGGDAADDHGFFVTWNTEQSDDADAETGADADDAKTETAANADDAGSANRQENDAEQENLTEDKSANFFERLVMKIKRTGSYRADKQKGQGTKKAQKNAQKAAKKATKKKKTKQTAESRTSAQADNSKSDKTEATGDAGTEQTESGQQKTTQGAEKSTQGKEQTTQSAGKTAQSTEQTTEKTTQEKENQVQCTLTISCATLLAHMDDLAENKRAYVPEDGVLLRATVAVKSGSSVFDVLQKAAKDNQLQLEYNYTPVYKNYYIEGIGNIYEFDGGKLSGWMYCVNGEFPGTGCSSYRVSDGDEILFLYTCNLGKDVGGYFAE